MLITSDVELMVSDFLLKRNLTLDNNDDWYTACSSNYEKQALVFCI